jgi:hypothetical protein
MQVFLRAGIVCLVGIFFTYIIALVYEPPFPTPKHYTLKSSFPHNHFKTAKNVQTLLIHSNASLIASMVHLECPKVLSEQPTLAKTSCIEVFGTELESLPQRPTVEWTHLQYIMVEGIITNIKVGHKDENRLSFVFYTMSDHFITFHLATCALREMRVSHKTCDGNCEYTFALEANNKSWLRKRVRCCVYLHFQKASRKRLGGRL